MLTKTCHSKGRISLGKRFANRTFIIEEAEDMALRLEPARVVPEPEAWLYENKNAEASVRRGLEQAKARKFRAVPPDLKADFVPPEEPGDEE
jgi:hypothetical protein